MRLFVGIEWFRGLDTLSEVLFKPDAQFGLVQDTAFSDGSKDALLRLRGSVTIARSTAELARIIVYSPDMDGQIDPGEVAWTSLQLEGENAALRERAVIVVGRHDQYFPGMLISARSEHSE